MTTSAPPPRTLPVSLADVRAAAGAIAGAVVHTPTTVSQTLSEITGARVWLKFENLQFTASFKERGALNFLLALPDAARARGRRGGVRRKPRAGPRPPRPPARHPGDDRHAGRDAVHQDHPHRSPRRRSGARRRRLRRARSPAALALAAESGATFVPAFDDPLIIAGQGTVGLEILDAVPDVDTIIVPVGGGGLVSGIAVAAKALRPDIDIVGAQVEGYTGMVHALGRGPEPRPEPTIAEGIAVTAVGVLTQEIVGALVDDLVVVTEQHIEAAVALAAEIEKTVVEGAGAAGLAALVEYPERFRDRTVVVVLTGGNIDLRMLSSALLRALARSGRLVRLAIEVTDRPGVLAEVAQVIGELRGNIVDVAHRRDLPGVALKTTRLEVSVETRDRAHAEAIVTALDQAGYPVVT